MKWLLNAALAGHYQEPKAADTLPWLAIEIKGLYWNKRVKEELEKMQGKAAGCVRLEELSVRRMEGHGC